MYSLLPLGVIIGAKSVEKLHYREQKKCVRESFSPIFILNEITVPVLRIIHFRKKWTEVLNEGVRSKLVSKVFLLFDINVKDRRTSGNLVA